ncbi:hypothetical protein CYMTET_36240 [Cymbomonas tetramitiformis]|uniref:Uncharacterized protein n=1 Tax=Cymbomonas tetramitiformis TaxID=36881 RepID=A0AAE0CGC4_9CHLO|nr:hypothetical protein CYMTET_36240 [Cymbomonas tetramitiformis]
MGVLTDLHVEGCTAGLAGGGLYVEGGNVIVHGGRLSGNWAGETGGAVFGTASEQVMRRQGIQLSLVDVRLEGHISSRGAGLMEPRGCHFQQNVATANGGAVFLELSSQTTNLSGCEFVENQALGTSEGLDGLTGNGGVLFLRATEGFQSVNLTHLEGLAFGGNRAAQGGAIGFWQPLDLFATPDPPECAGCLLDGSDAAGYGSADGWATQAMRLEVDPVQAEEVGGLPVKNDLVVRIMDASGQVVAVDNSSRVELRFREPEKCALKEGTYWAQARRGIFTFSGESTDLQLKGNPGTNCQIYFILHELGLETNTSVVPLRSCLPGEEAQEIEAFRYCVPCAEGFLSLGNSTDCVECAQELECSANDVACPLECPGGDEFVVCQGAYVAPQAAHCGMDTVCFLQRVYMCEQGEACTTGDTETCGAGDSENVGRVGRGLDSFADLRLCNEESYAGVSTVLCGSKLPVLCSVDHFPSREFDTCKPCNPREQVLATFVVMCSALAVMFAALFALFFIKPKAAENEDTTSVADKVYEKAMNGEALGTSVEILKAKFALSLMIGYVQVLGQLSQIYPTNLMPDGMQKLLGAFGLLNMNLSTMLNLDCISYYFLPAQLTGGTDYSFAFMQAVVSPVVLVVLISLIYFYMVWRHESQRQQALHAARQMGAPEPDEEAKKEAEVAEMTWRAQTRSTCMGAALFMMMFVHPGISTTMFQLFNCDAIHFDDPTLQIQYWLKMDSEMECFTTWWTTYVSISSFVFSFYVLGFPIMLFYGMQNLRAYQKVRMPRDVAQRHIDLVLAGQWIPCHADDVAAVQLGKTFIASSPAASLRADVITTLVRLWVTSAKSSCDKPDRAVLRALACRWRERAAMGRSSQPVELFLHGNSFRRCDGEDASSIAVAQKQMRGSAVPEVPRSARKRMLSRASTILTRKADPEYTLLLNDGRVVNRVVCFQKLDKGIGGTLVEVPVTRLDDPHYSKACSSPPRRFRVHMMTPVIFRLQ